MMKKQKNSIPSFNADIFKSILISIIIIEFLIIVFEIFGSAEKVDLKITSLFGAILAFSGLMIKQYLLKENIEYLRKWEKIKLLIDKIILHKNSQLLQDDDIEQLVEKKGMVSQYINYVITEIKIVPVIPLLLVIFYGAALIATECLYFSLVCLALMLLLVAYLSLATITSNNLAIDTTEIDETIQDFEEVLTSMNKK